MTCVALCLLYFKYSQLRLIEPPVNRFIRLIGSKKPGPEVALLSGFDCISVGLARMLQCANIFVHIVVIQFVTHESGNSMI